MIFNLEYYFCNLTFISQINFFLLYYYPRKSELKSTSDFQDTAVERKGHTMLRGDTAQVTCQCFIGSALFSFFRYNLMLN